MFGLAVAFSPVSEMRKWAGRKLSRAKPADYAWAAIIGGGIVYELLADDLLSEATDRYRAAHPLLERLVIIAIAGHLGGMIPAALDIFNAQNLLHRGVVAMTGAD